MSCPLCGCEVPPNTTSCPNCSSVATPGAEVLAVPLAPARSRPPSKYSWAFRLGAWALSLGCWYTIVMMSLLTTVRTRGPFTAESFGYLIGTILGIFLLPLIGVFLYYNRKRTPRSPMHRKVLLVSALAMMFSLLPSPGSRFSSTGFTKERMSILAKEGTGLLPVSRDESIWDSPARSCFADVAEFSRRYQEEAHKLDQSALNDLYSADSFRDSKHIEKVLTQLRAYLALEEKYASLDSILERNKARIQSVDAPDSVKSQFLIRLSSSAQEALADRSALFAKEKAWIQSSIDLYEFTLAKRASYALRDGKLVFKDRIVMSEFNQRAKDALGRKADVLQAKENFEKRQKEALRKFNLQPADMRFPPETQPANKPK